MWKKLNKINVKLYTVQSGLRTMGYCCMNRYNPIYYNFPLLNRLVIVKSYVLFFFFEQIIVLRSMLFFFSIGFTFMKLKEKKKVFFWRINFSSTLFRKSLGVSFPLFLCSSSVSNYKIFFYKFVYLFFKIYF